MAAKKAGRRTRDLYSRTIAKIPEEPLHERVLQLAEPLLERLGPQPAPTAVRQAIELAIAFWNAKLTALDVWGDARPKPFNDLKRKMTSKRAVPGEAEAFEQLTACWVEKAFVVDPRLVGEWSLEVTDEGRPRLSCEMELPEGVEAEVPPAIEKRVAIDGKFLDQVRIRMTANSHLGFPIEAHSAQVNVDGSVLVRTKMPIAVALLAQGTLPALGGPPVELMVTGKLQPGMVLCDVTCTGEMGRQDVAVLRFERVPSGTASHS